MQELDHIAAVLRGGMKLAEGYAEAQPDSEDKTDAIHHLNRAHEHLNKAMLIAVRGQHMQVMDGDPKP